MVIINLSHADLVLLSPAINALRRLMDNCESYATGPLGHGNMIDDIDMEKEPKMFSLSKDSQVVLSQSKSKDTVFRASIIFYTCNL